MLLQNASHDILVHLNAEGIRNLLGDFQRPELRVSAFHLHHGGNELRRGTLRPRFCAALAGIEQSVLAADQGFVKPHESRRLQRNRNLRSPTRRQPKRVQTEEQTIPRGQSGCALSPSLQHQQSWCLRARDCATTARTPPGCASLTRGESKWAIRMTSFF